MITRRLFLSLLFAPTGSLLGGCYHAPSAANGSASQSGLAGASKRAEPLKILATVGMVADLARQVGGPYVTVRQLMGAGVDPHLYKATRDDVQAMLSADIVLYSGWMLEGKLADTLHRLADKQPVHAIAEKLEPAQLIAADDGAEQWDPHVWMDVRLWSNCVTTVANACLQSDPAHETEYREAAARYQEQLAQLDAYGRTTLATIPPAQRVLVTSHDAFRYFGRAYGLDVQGVQGLSTDSEAGLQRINALVDFLVERQIQAVFVESSVPRKSIEALVDGAAARGHQILIGGQLYSDAMGDEGTYEGSYIGMLDHNITRVARALGGSAPEHGWQGRLAPHPP
jgi:manganese/zinc/iron transport system substrate-binding protein